LQQVATEPDICRRASRSPAPHPVLGASLALLGSSDLAAPGRDHGAACAEIKRITSVYGKLASAPTTQVEDIHSKIVTPSLGSLPPACRPSGRIGGSPRAVEVRDVGAHAAECEALKGPSGHRATAACLRSPLERGGARA
jgi:hypothetical protein